MMLKLFEVINGTFQIKAMLEYKSLVWEECYNDTGVMQAVFAKSDYIMQTVTVGSYAMLDVEKNTIMYIHSIQITDTELWAYGYEIKELLRKQAMLNTDRTEGTVDVAEKLVENIDNYVGFSWYDHTVNAATLGNANLDGLEYTSVYEYIQGICKLFDAGFYVFFDNWETYKGNISIYEGGDKSAQVKLATQLGNISGLSYTYTDKDFIARVYMYGTDDVWVYADADSYDELYSVAVDMREEFPRDENMTIADYSAALTIRAKQSVAARKSKRTIEVKDADLSAYDVRLGDIVTVEIPDAGVATTKRIVKITHTVNNAVMQTRYTFANP